MTRNSLRTALSLTLLATAIATSAGAGIRADDTDNTIKTSVDNLKVSFERERKLYAELTAILAEPESTLQHNRNWETVSDAFMNWSETLSKLATESRELADLYTGLTVEFRNALKAKVQELDYPYYYPLFERLVSLTVAYEPWTYPILSAELSFSDSSYPGWIGKPIFNVETMRRDYRALYNIDAPAIRWSTALVEDTQPAGLAPALNTSWKATHALLSCRGGPLTCALKSDQGLTLQSHLSRYLRPTFLSWTFQSGPVVNFEFVKESGDSYIKYGEDIALVHLGDPDSGMAPTYVTADDTDSSWRLILRHLPSTLPKEWQLQPIWHRMLEQAHYAQHAQTFALYNTITQKYLVNCPRGGAKLGWYAGSNPASTDPAELTNFVPLAP
jgi:hypothetical protein